MKAIFAVMRTTRAVVKISSEKIRPVWDLKTWLLRYRCSALPTFKLSSQMGASYYVTS